MAMQTYVFYKKDQLPTTQELQLEINKNGIDLTLPEQMDLKLNKQVCIHSEFEGLESEFDYIHDIYDSEEWEWEDSDLTVLGNPSEISVFNTYSNAQEIVGMMITSAALSKLTGGPIYSDFFSEELITPDEAIEFAKDIVESSRDQFSGPSVIRRNSGDDIDEPEISPEDLETIAKDVLESIQGNYTASHDFSKANIQDYSDLDTNAYNDFQSELEKNGFTHLCDVEDKTVSLSSDIKTVIRTMQHSETNCIAAFYYIPTIGIGIYEFETFFNDGNIVVSTISPESIEITKYPLIHFHYYDFETRISDLFQLHLSSIKGFNSSSLESDVMKITTFEELVDAQNFMNRHKHDEVSSIGWVTKEYLVSQTNGDIALAEKVYSEISKLVNRTN